MQDMVMQDVHYPIVYEVLLFYINVKQIIERWGVFEPKLLNTPVNAWGRKSRGRLIEREGVYWRAAFKRRGRYWKIYTVPRYVVIAASTVKLSNSCYNFFIQTI